MERGVERRGTRDRGEERRKEDYFKLTVKYKNVTFKEKVKVLVRI